MMQALKDEAQWLLSLPMLEWKETLSAWTGSSRANRIDQSLTKNFISLLRVAEVEDLQN
jgi:hypothetical protein